MTNPYASKHLDTLKAIWTFPIENIEPAAPLSANLKNEYKNTPAILLAWGIKLLEAHKKYGKLTKKEGQLLIDDAIKPPATRPKAPP